MADVDDKQPNEYTEDELKEMIETELQNWFHSPYLPDPTEAFTKDQLKEGVRVESLCEMLFRAGVIDREEFDKFFAFNYLEHLQSMREQIEPMARKQALMQGIGGPKVVLPPGL